MPLKVLVDVQCDNRGWDFEGEYHECYEKTQGFMRIQDGKLVGKPELPAGWTNKASVNYDVGTVTRQVFCPIHTK
jgi:hypothetical protein